MNSSYLTKHLSKLALTVNLTVTIMVWLYCISTNNPTLISLIQSYIFLDINTVKVIITIVCAILVIRSITAYESKVIQFVQADLLKEILMELKSFRESIEGPVDMDIFLLRLFCYVFYFS